MFQNYNMKGWIKWPLVRAHLCTLAVSVGFATTWRAPREAMQYGGLQFALVTTVASLVVLPLALLQLALGQLSQQDTVGIWRAVPFFKGVGYLRLLVSALVCVYSSVYVALSVAYFLYTLSHSIPFRACSDPRLDEIDFQYIINSTQCLNATFLAPVTHKPEYYVAVSLIIFFIWISLPFMLYSPVKLMKRIFYGLGPTLVLVGITVVSCIGSWGNLRALHARDWRAFVSPGVWHAALAQALLSSQLAGGYLVAAGDAIYSSTNVQWTAVAFVATNIVSMWCGVLFWFGIAGGVEPDSSVAAVLELTYRAALEQDLSLAWPLVVFAALILSGVITMLTFLYPVFDRMRRVGGVQWRVACAGGAALGAVTSLAVLAGRWDALALLEDVAVPLIASAATVLEVVAFIFVYGWKVLKDDVEFLTGQDLSKFWVLGWCAAPGVILPLTLWWAVATVLRGEWAAPCGASGVVAILALMLVVILALAAVAVARQVQFDVIGKLRSSFRPSRHWGPRDPIAHYYWLARRDEGPAAAPGRARRYRRRQPGQLAGANSFFDVPTLRPASKDINSNEVKKRSNSDDWIFTVYRRKYLEEAFSEYLAKSKQFRSHSVDLAKLPRVALKKDSTELNILNSSDFMKSDESVESLKEASIKIVTRAKK